jgi:hypothetical protein
MNNHRKGKTRRIKGWVKRLKNDNRIKTGIWTKKG